MYSLITSSIGALPASAIVVRSMEISTHNKIAFERDNENLYGTFYLIDPLCDLDDGQVPVLVGLADRVDPRDVRELCHEAVQLVHQLGVVVVVSQLRLKQLCAL